MSATEALPEGCSPEECSCFVQDTEVYCTNLARSPGTTERISVAGDGTEGNASSFDPEISANGRSVAYASEASNLVPDDTNDATDVFVASTYDWLV
jgi:hypothetical protein